MSKPLSLCIILKLFIYLSINKLAKELNAPCSYTSKVQAAIVAHLDVKVVSANDTRIRVLASTSALDMDMWNLRERKKPK